MVAHAGDEGHSQGWQGGLGKSPNSIRPRSCCSLQTPAEPRGLGGGCPLAPPQPTLSGSRSLSLHAHGDGDFLSSRCWREKSDPVPSLPCQRRGSREKASLWCGAARDTAVSGQADGVTPSCCRPGPIPIPPPAPRPSPLSPAYAGRWRLHAPSLPWHPKRETELWAPPIPVGQWPWGLLSPPERSWQFLLTVSSRCSSSSSSSSSAKPAGPPHVPRRPRLLMWMSQGMKRSTCCSPDLPGNLGIRLCQRSCARLDACAGTGVVDQAQ